MKHLDSNERQLADKLRQVPLPDVNRGWEQMRELLDEEQPEARGAGWGGNKKWWWMVAIAVLIMAGLWLRENQNTVVTQAQSEIKSQPANDEKPAVIIDNKNQAGSVSENKIVVKENDVNSSAAVVQSEEKTSGAIKQSDKSVERKLIAVKHSEKNFDALPAGNKQANVFLNNVDEKYTSSRDIRLANTNFSVPAKEKPSPADEFENSTVSASDAIAISGKTDKAYLKQLRKIVEKDNRRVSRSSMRGNFGDDGREITFAAGITIPQSFALGQQQSSSYSISGKSNRVMDYLPAPFFQYHINNKLFLQTELHFQAPQYTNRLLLASSATQPSTGVRLEKNVYLEKLYYFNIPFNLYYTPAKNFSIGSGLQYSNLLSGVASFEERRVDGQTTSNLSSTTRRFKDDSVAAKFAPSEWRYQFDANYYLKRFTLGLRYNHALKDFVNLQVTPGLPNTQDRNKSFLLYLRYNIWEERKKD